MIPINLVINVTVVHLRFILVLLVLPPRHPLPHPRLPHRHPPGEFFPVWDTVDHFRERVSTTLTA